MQQILGREGYNCLAAGEDKLALEILRSNRVDLVIQDLYRSGDLAAGCKFIEVLKSDPQLRHIPIFVLSSASNESGENRFSAAGVDFASIAGYQSKPFDPRELIAKIEEILGE